MKGKAALALLLLLILVPLTLRYSMTPRAGFPPGGNLLPVGTRGRSGNKVHA